MTTPMTDSEVRQAIARGLAIEAVGYPEEWRVLEDEADAALAALKDAGLDLQELQAKAAAWDELYAEIECKPVRYDEWNELRATRDRILQTHLKAER